MVSTDKRNPPLFVVLSDKEEASSEEDVLTPKKAAHRIARNLQNIYLEIASQNSPEGLNTHDELQKSFSMREYAEMFMLRNIEDEFIIKIYHYIQNSKDWNDAILPLNWGYITFQREPKVSFLVFMTAVLQGVMRDLYLDFDEDSTSQ